MFDKENMVKNHSNTATQDQGELYTLCSLLEIQWAKIFKLNEIT